jgi:uncharacterized protein (TIGR00730 family)
VAAGYFAVAEELGAEIARRGWSLVWGGCKLGLMGTVARAVKGNGGQACGVIPHAIHSRGLAFEAADEMIVTAHMRERKATMEFRADAFIGLPGGLGTLEEMAEIITLKQLDYHLKPIVFLNHKGYWDKLLEWLEVAYSQNFIKHSSRELYHVSPTVADAFLYLESYQPPQITGKWFQVTDAR